MKSKLLKLFLTAVLLLAARLIERYADLSIWQLLLIYLVPYFIVSYEVLHEACEGILEGNPFDENFLMSIATIGALAIGFLPGAENQFAEAVFVMFFFQVGEMFEHNAAHRSRKNIEKLMDLRPDTAHVVRSEEVSTVHPSEVRPGETILVQPGEKIPLDGVLIEGSTTLNTVALTGEAMPRTVKVPSKVLSGCINMTGVIRIKVEKAFEESTAMKILNIVEHARDNKSHSETFIRRFARRYTPFVVIAALLLAFVPPFFADSYSAAFGTWLYRALTFLVVSCPCALVISIPLTFFSGIGGASKEGILIKGGNFMDVLAKVRTVVMDKTGTLTEGRFQVRAVHPAEVSNTQLLHLAAHVERYSTHPIATALREAYPETDASSRVSHINEYPGMGISAKVDDRTVFVGNEQLMKRSGIALPVCGECSAHHGTVIHIADEQKYLGHIVIDDRIKPDAAQAVQRMRRLGIQKLVMLTGDKKAVAQSVAENLGIAQWYAELLPVDKVNHTERLLHEQQAGSKLAFVGDGINDAPVLARADVGIAMGALGSEAAIEAADVVLMDDKPSKIATAVAISRRTLNIARQNAVFAIGIKVGVLILAACGIASMALAVFADVGVMMLAVLNATRALHTRRVQP